MENELEKYRELDLKLLQNVVEKLRAPHEAKSSKLEELFIQEAKLKEENAKLQELIAKMKQTDREVREATVKLQFRHDQLREVDESRNDFKQTLVDTFNLLGFHVSDYEGSGETRNFTLAYNKEPDFFVKLKHSPTSVELLEMNPPHPLIENIKEYLSATRDMRNFLEMVQRFFLIYKLSDARKSLAAIK